ncbi:MAG: saccharopine dehydrogenase NADP-binding domain-containing protein [Syntrophobacteraceae bacterium]|nr:saccharopine dehydrogenase NADP-binding domain-containing protein [Syntrophobacteraceae bacterium]
MIVAVLGGMGLQGRAALLDLTRSKGVDKVLCADAVQSGDLGKLERFIDRSKIEMVPMDGSSKRDIVRVLKKGADVAIDLLPVQLMPLAFEAAIEAGVSLVSTNYAHTLKHLHQPALKAGMALMPECGLDPGIDLVICGQAAREFDEIHVINSYCGGFPEKKACTNPLNYKISWNWDMVLRSHKRPAVLIRDGRKVSLSAEEQHREDMITNIDFPGLGEVEAIPNGDTLAYTDLLGITKTVREAGRYALRWPGWSSLLRPLKQLGFLSEEPIDVDGCLVSPHQFMVKHLEPRLQYQDDEKDLVAMLNVFKGIKKGKKASWVNSLLIERDLETGLLAMNFSVAGPASIVAQMIARGDITQKGLLAPAVDVPYEPFMKELERRRIVVKEEVS